MNANCFKRVLYSIRGKYAIVDSPINIEEVLLLNNIVASK